MTAHQIIRDEKGRPAYAVLPWKDYVALVPEAAEAALSDEELMDQALAEIAADPAGGGPWLSLDLVERLANGESPIRIYREHLGLTQAQLAERIGTNRVYLAQVEGGRRTGSLKLRRKLAEQFGVDLDDLEPHPVVSGQRAEGRGQKSDHF